MADSKRCFISLPIPETWREVAASVIDGLRSEVSASYRFEPLENLHVTVRFLGDVADDTLEAVQSGLCGIARSPAPTGRLLGAGFFSHDAAHVLCQWIEDLDDSLAETHRRVNRELDTLPVAPLTFAYVPHLTLGRTGRDDGESDDRIARARIDDGHPDLLRTLAELDPWTFECLELRESVRSADGTVSFPVLSSYEFH